MQDIGECEPHHQHSVSAKPAAGDGGEIGVRVEEAAAGGLPVPLAAHQAHVPAGSGAVGAVARSAERDVDGAVQGRLRMLICMVQRLS